MSLGRSGAKRRSVPWLPRILSDKRDYRAARWSEIKRKAHPRGDAEHFRPTLPTP
jgi:hypothetical protein